MRVGVGVKQKYLCNSVLLHCGFVTALLEYISIIAEVRVCSGKVLTCSLMLDVS